MVKRFCLLLALFLVTLAMLISSGSQAQQNTPGCPPWTQWFGIWQPGSGNIVLNTSSLNQTYKDQVEAARVVWNNGLPTQGISFVNPPASTATGATLTIVTGSIPTQPNGSNPVAVITSTTYQNGYLVAATITLDPSKTINGVRVLDNSANILKAVLHEIGHTLGLGHHPFDPSLPCGGQTTPSVMNAMCGPDATNMPIALTDCDKAGARESYFPTAPSPTPTPIPDDSGGGFCTNSCPQKAGWSQEPYPDCTCHWEPITVGDSPILIDVKGNGFVLTSAFTGVAFDLNIDGQKEQIAWTIYGEDDSWLTMDRNRNGIIDDGSELFGNTSGFENGFLMLAELDSDLNGQINSNDFLFSELKLWNDSNHNGISESGELISLPSNFEISLDYKQSNRTDRFGNLFLYRSKIDGTRWAYDVFLTRR